MKKIFSLLLVGIMVFFLLPTAFAADDVNYQTGTQVTIEGKGVQEYTVTVPATLKPGQTGTVTASGYWPAKKMLQVTAPESITVYNTENSSTARVDVVFEDMEIAGHDAYSISGTANIKVTEGNMKFGTWVGKITYDVKIVDKPIEIIDFTISGEPFQAVAGMSWKQWFESEYNTLPELYGVEPTVSGFIYFYTDGGTVGLFYSEASYGRRDVMDTEGVMSGEAYRFMLGQNEYELKKIPQPGATFSDGVTLSWEELKLEENGTKYLYDASQITDTSFGTAFYGNSKLVSIILPNTITSIDTNAFFSTNIETLTIPVSVTHLGAGLFTNTTLTTLNYAGTTEQWSALVSASGEWNKVGPVTEVICSNGTVSLVEANLITFTISGTEYQAEEGMTWGEFIASDFNTDQLVHGTTAEVYIKRSAGGSTTDAVMNSSNKAVMVTDLIEANGVYTKD